MKLSLSRDDFIAIIHEELLIEQYKSTGLTNPQGEEMIWNPDTQEYILSSEVPAGATLSPLDAADTGVYTADEWDRHYDPEDPPSKTAQTLDPRPLAKDVATAVASTIPTGTTRPRRGGRTITHDPTDPDKLIVRDWTKKEFEDAKASGAISADATYEEAEVPAPSLQSSKVVAAAGHEGSRAVDRARAKAQNPANWKFDDPRRIELDIAKGYEKVDDAQRALDDFNKNKTPEWHYHQRRMKADADALDNYKGKGEYARLKGEYRIHDPNYEKLVYQKELSRKAFDNVDKSLTRGFEGAVKTAEDALDTNLDAWEQNHPGKKLDPQPMRHSWWKHPLQAFRGDVITLEDGTTHYRPGSGLRAKVDKQNSEYITSKSNEADLRNKLGDLEARNTAKPGSVDDFELQDAKRQLKQAETATARDLRKVKNLRQFGRAWVIGGGASGAAATGAFSKFIALVGAGMSGAEAADWVLGTKDMYLSDLSPIPFTAAILGQGPRLKKDFGFGLLPKATYAGPKGTISYWDALDTELWKDQDFIAAQKGWIPGLQPEANKEATSARTSLKPNPEQTRAGKVNPQASIKWNAMNNRYGDHPGPDGEFGTDDDVEIFGKETKIGASGRTYGARDVLRPEVPDSWNNPGAPPPGRRPVRDRPRRRSGAERRQEGVQRMNKLDSLLNEEDSETAQVEDIPHDPTTPENRKLKNLFADGGEGRPGTYDKNYKMAKQRKHDFETGKLKGTTGDVNEGNLDRIIEELITEEIEEYVSETNVLNRWSELAGLSEMSGMAAGSVGGAAGGSSPSFWGAFGPERRKDDDELEEAKDTSFSEAGEEIEKKGTEGVFTAKARKAGMGVQAYADKVLQKGSNASTKTKRQAAFAKGAATVARENK